MYFFSCHKFDGVGVMKSKMDPTLSKTSSVTDQLIQVLLACASGDLESLKT